MSERKREEKSQSGSNVVIPQQQKLGMYVSAYVGRGYVIKATDR